MIDRRNMDNLADAEDRGNVVDQQTAVEAGIEQVPGDSGTDSETASESEAHPS